MSSPASMPFDFLSGSIVERALFNYRLVVVVLCLLVTSRNNPVTTFDRINLRFVVVDGDGHPHGNRAVAFVMPGPLRFLPGDSYCDEVHVPTGGGHERPGFDVRVEVAGEVW